MHKMCVHQANSVLLAQQATAYSLTRPTGVQSVADTAGATRRRCKSIRCVSNRGVFLVVIAGNGGFQERGSKESVRGYARTSSCGTSVYCMVYVCVCQNLISVRAGVNAKCSSGC